MEFYLQRTSQDEPFLILEAKSRYDVPTAITEGTASGPSAASYARELIESGAATVMAIASRMGRDVEVIPQGEEPTLLTSIAEARAHRSSEESENRQRGNQRAWRKFTGTRRRPSN